MSSEQMVNKKLAVFKMNRKTAIYRYLELTRSMHKLTKKQILLLTEFIYLFNKERGNFKREEDTWAYVFNRDNRHNIREKLNFTKQVFENYMYNLRKKGVIEGDKVSRRVSKVFNPYVDPNCKEYELIFKFIIDGEDV